MIEGGTSFHAARTLSRVTPPESRRAGLGVATAAKLQRRRLAMLRRSMRTSLKTMIEGGTGFHAARTLNRAIRWESRSAGLSFATAAERQMRCLSNAPAVEEDEPEDDA